MRKEGSLERNREEQGERKSTVFKDIHTYGQLNTPAKGAVVS